MAPLGFNREGNEMSGKSVAAKINKAMTKVGNKIGFISDVYRPDNYAQPVDDRNRILDNVSIAWSVDEGFVKNPVDELSHYIVYAADLQVGDIIVCEEQGTTLVLTELDPIRAPAGILANDRVDVYRSVFVGGNVKHEFNLVAFEVPCAVKVGKAAPVTAPNTTMKSGMTHIDVWTWMPVDEIQINDVIDWRDNRFLVNSVNASDKGTKIIATSMKAGK